MPSMTDMHAVAVFRFFRGYQFVFASDALYSESGPTIGYHPHHGNLLDAWSPTPT